MLELWISKYKWEVLETLLRQNKRGGGQNKRDLGNINHQDDWPEIRDKDQKNILEKPGTETEIKTDTETETDTERKRETDSWIATRDMRNESWDKRYDTRDKGLAARGKERQETDKSQIRDRDQDTETKEKRETKNEDARWWTDSATRGEDQKIEAERETYTKEKGQKK